MSIDFVLDAFNSELRTDTIATLPDGTEAPVISADAVAVYYASVDAMKNAFYFQSDSRDISDYPETGSDIKYFVDWPDNYVLNPCHAYVSEDEIAKTDANGNIESGKMLVKHDFIRHIAKELFNTHLAVDLFENEEEIRQDLAVKGHDVWVSQIKPVIDNVSIGGLGGLAPNGYTTDENPNNTNICRVLFQQILYNHPDRFLQLDGLIRENTVDKFCLPFKDGDSIQFKVVLKPANGQENIIANANADIVPDRSYAIKLCIVPTVTANGSHAIGTNVIVTDASDLNDSCVLIPPEN